ncbi:MAG: hypothetical protein K1Y36_14470 [Blastocatellia bacterium]|nr:hypothetical protein [Blastocatellia bacterium]
MRTVRNILQKTDSVTDSAATARDEIGRAVAAKIREINHVDDLKSLAEDVLPELEKFLESPEERRLRRFRVGTMMALIGMGATLFLLFLGVAVGENKIPWPIGIVPFFIGIGIILNGLFFTLPPKTVSDYRPHAKEPNLLDQPTSFTTAQLRQNAAMQNMLPPPSVTENTTEMLKEKQPVELLRGRDTN